MRNASGDNSNSSFIVDDVMGQIPRSTERISSYKIALARSTLSAHNSLNVVWLPVSAGTR